MQKYTPLGDTATETVKQALLNHEDNIDSIRSSNSGSSFPTEHLVVGMKCYRTDLKATYTYNGTSWDKETDDKDIASSVTTKSLVVSGETSVPTPSTENNSQTIANTEFVHGVVNKLVNGAPSALDTLQELSAALGDDPNFSTTVLNKIGEKESKEDANIEHTALKNTMVTGVDEVAGGALKVSKGDGTSKTVNAGLNMLARNKSYAVGDIAYSPNLPSYLYLECITAGTTGATEPDMSTIKSGGVTLNDGTVKFSVKTVCAREYVESKQNDLIKKLCINAGDTVINANDVDIWLDGGITNGGKALLFMIPFCKPILAKSVIVNSLKIIARQSGTYILGDSNGNYVNATSRITIKIVTNNGVHIEVQFPTAITQINNDAVSCQIKYKMTFQ